MRRSRTGARRSVAAASSDNRNRVGVRLAQVITGDRESIVSVLGDQTCQWFSAIPMPQSRSASIAPSL